MFNEIIIHLAVLCAVYADLNRELQFALLSCLPLWFHDVLLCFIEMEIFFSSYFMLNTQSSYMNIYFDD